jgi:hypothetical protein
MSIAILVAVAASGCGGGSGSSGTIAVMPSMEPIVVNSPGSFLIVGVAGAVTGLRDYWWPCSTGQANLTVAQGTGSGNIRLEIYDAIGSLVHDNTYQGAIGGAVAALTRPGATPGTWHLRFTFDVSLWTGTIALDADTLGVADEIVIGSGLAGTLSLTYQLGWSAGSAQVVVGTGLSSGSARIRLWDPSGTPVFDQTFGSMTTAFSGNSVAGTAGTWTVRIDVTGSTNASAITVNHPRSS